MNAQRPFTSARPILTLLLVAGSALALTACGGTSSARRAEQAPVTQTAQTTSGSSQNFTHAGTVRSRGTSPTRQARQFDPFWIEAAAAADRDLWMGNPVALDPGAPATTGGTLLARQTTEFALPANPDALGPADTVEGLTHVTFAAEGADFDPCLSRDGAFMVFASTQHRPTADIYLKKVGSRTVTQLTADPAHDLMPAISPDGRRIAFASNRTGNWDIYVMAATGGQAVQLTNDASHEVAPSWSPDGQRLVFNRFGEMSGRWEMWVMEAGASASAEFLGYGLFPKWCPTPGTGLDGRDKILFQRSRERGDRAFSLWTIDYRPGDASSPTEVASRPGAALINADWAPDGERIVYASVENPGSAGEPSDARPGVSDLWMANIDGSGRVNLTSGRFMNLMPAWSRDGRIYFVSNRSGMTNIWSLGTDKAIYAAMGNPPRANPTTTASNPDHFQPHDASVTSVPTDQGHAGEH